jgi:hypothetical protein
VALQAQTGDRVCALFPVVATQAVRGAGPGSVCLYLRDGHRGGVLPEDMLYCGANVFERAGLLAGGYC